MSLRLLSLAVLAVTLAAAGCAGSSPTSDEYEATVLTIRDRVDGSLAHITDNPAGRDELLERMEEASESIAKAADDLDEEGAPKDLEDENEELVTALKQLSTDLSATAEQVRTPGFEDLLGDARGLSFESWVEVNRILERLNAQGIDVPPLARH